MYTLDNDFATRFKYEVMIVGCGGTGGFVAEGLCRLLPVNVPLVLVDPDRVEERNLRRQNFFTEELGKLKSEALAQRLSQKYHRAIAYSILPVSLTPLGFNSMVIGCVITVRHVEISLPRFNRHLLQCAAWCLYAVRRELRPDFDWKPHRGCTIPDHRERRPLLLLASALSSKAGLA